MSTNSSNDASASAVQATTILEGKAAAMEGKHEGKEATSAPEHGGGGIAPGIIGAAAGAAMPLPPRVTKAASAAAPAQRAFGRLFSGAEQSDWLERIRARQASRMTPARRQELKARAARQVRASKASRKAGKMRSASAISSRVWQRGSCSVDMAMQDAMAAPPAAAAAGGGGGGGGGGGLLGGGGGTFDGAAFRRQRQAQKRAALTATVELCAAELAQLQTSVTSDMRARGDDEEEGDAFERTLAGNAQLAADAAAGMVSGSELSAVLAQLRVEPTDDEECSAKFKIFEGYSKIVEDLRKETFGFWDECKADFDGPAARATEQQLKGFDSNENMGIADNAHVWFVHAMTRRCHSNNAVLARVLAGIKTKLDLLSRQEECPVCFEPFASRPFTTLSCCHKVCTDCWSHWVQMRGGSHAPCPLCRNDEFLGSVGGIL